MPIDPPVNRDSDDRSGWKPARLIPTVGIRGAEEQEKRATASLLAVMRAVPEFGHALVGELGAPRSPLLETFTEVRFKTPDGKTVIPDGAISCRRGGKVWTCLVEVKTGSMALRPEQVAAYMDIAKEHGFDGVLTISNDITPGPSDSPITVDGRKSRKTALWHFSWWHIITSAVVQSRYRGVSDPDQAWVLNELIAYLEDPASGAGDFDDLGDRWVAVRKAAHDGTLRAGDADARAVAERWEQFIQYLCLGLSQDLGRTVTVQRRRNELAPARLETLIKSLAATGSLESTIRVPDAVGDVRVRADLRGRQTLTTVTLEAPKEGRAKTCLSWLLRQLRDAPDGLRLEVAYPNARDTTGALLSQARERPERLLYAPDPKREPRAFVVTLARPMGQKRGKGEGSFVRETVAQAFDFYREIVQNLRPWQPKAPRLRELDDEAMAENDDGVGLPDVLAELRPDSEPSAEG